MTATASGTGVIAVDTSIVNFLSTNALAIGCAVTVITGDVTVATSLILFYFKVRCKIAEKKLLDLQIKSKTEIE